MFLEVIGVELNESKETEQEKLLRKSDRLYLCLFNLCIHHKNYSNSTVFILPVLQKFINCAEVCLICLEGSEKIAYLEQLQTYANSLKSYVFTDLVPEDFINQLRQLR